MNLNRRLQTIYRVLMCLLLGLPMLAQAADETTLFEEALVFSPPDATSHVLRSRSVIVTDTLLTGVNTLQQRSASPDANTAPVAKSLTLNLFDDLVVSAKLTNAYQNRSGSR
ncbi:MAG: hypothetical protein ACPG47_08275, partial [Leucothrix sp.]